MTEPATSRPRARLASFFAAAGDRSNRSASLCLRHREIYPSTGTRHQLDAGRPHLRQGFCRRTRRHGGG